ncbi:MAG: hypothetical protein AAGC68_08365 [Verrucomicrobiota bacterium]
MRSTETSLESISHVADVTVDFIDAAITCLEFSSVCRFLISRDLSRDDEDCSITLGDSCHFHGDGHSFGFSCHPRVILSNAHGYWTAVDTDTIEVLPHPSSTPYPLIPISTHGFQWFRDQLSSGAYAKTWNHLCTRFENADPPERVHVTEIRVESGELSDPGN